MSNPTTVIGADPPLTPEQKKNPALPVAGSETGLASMKKHLTKKNVMIAGGLGLGAFLAVKLLGGKGRR